MYDNTNHWEECIVCNEKRNLKTHIITTKWANGQETCNNNNSYTKSCSCGYSEIGHRPCVWKGEYYSPDDQKLHARICSVCKTEIKYSYYLNTYGVGKIYSAEYENNKDPRACWRQKCSRSNGSMINCLDTGTCSICNHTYTNEWAKHRLVLGMPGKSKETIACAVCYEEFGTTTYDLKLGTDTPATNTITMNFKLNKGVTFYQTLPSGTEGMFTTYTQNISNKNSDGSEFTLTNIVKLNSSYTEPVVDGIYLTLQQNGVQMAYGSGYVKFYPDGIKPTITDISIENRSTWSKSKKIVVTGTENKSTNVNIEILDDKQNSIYKGKGAVNSGKYSISCIPELESGIENKTFKVIVTDACENSAEKEFSISKIDGIPPEVTSNNTITGEWGKERNFTFTATDKGIGNIQIAFNDINDYKLATKAGENYSRKYKFIGDSYQPTKARVFFKDELGNITTQEVTIDKIDNTSPTITNVQINNNKINIIANDRHKTLGEGSGITKYRFMTSTTKLENPEISTENSTEVSINEEIIIPNIDKVKYVYLIAEDLVRKCKQSI